MVGVYCQVDGVMVWSAGLTVSIWTVSERRVERLPARSSTCVSSVCEPSPVMCRIVPEGPDWTPPESRFHSTWSIADVESVPWTLTSTGTFDQPDCGGVVLDGTILSSWTTSSVQSVQRPLPSSARWLRTCIPLTLNVTI